MNQIVTVVKGGIVQEVYANPPSDVTVVDYDMQATNEVVTSSWVALPLTAMNDKLKANADPTRGGS